MSIIPKGRPKLPAVDVRKLAQANGVEIPRHGKVAVLHIRDYYLDTIGKPGKGDRNTYDDASWIILADRCIAFNFSTDPSAYRRGMATLVSPVSWIIPGKHKILSPSGYAAFRQFRNVKVVRDDFGEETGYFGINLHRGGVLGTSSEGCMTVPPLQWKEYRDTIYRALGVTEKMVLANPSGIPGKEFQQILVTKSEAEKLLGRAI